MNGIQNNLSIVVCNNADDAVAQGYNYTRPDFLPARIVKAVIVRDGTVSGLPTVDIIFEDEGGQRYVTMLTGRLIKTLAGVL